MVDSDDDYHRRNAREKFVRERNDYSDRTRQKDYDFDSRRNYQRGDYSNGASLKRSSSARREEHTSIKRSRIDSASDSYDPVIKTAQEEEPQLVMKTFKKFLATQDDSITDEEAIAKYSEYKMEFKRQELIKFFNSHKDEEFRLKYHPDESAKRKAEQKENVHRRLEIFQELQEKGRFNNLHIEFESAVDIIHIMDTLVVKLEGGTDDDVSALLDEVVEDESVTELRKMKSEKPARNFDEVDSSTNAANNATAESRDDGALSESDDDKKSDIGEKNDNRPKKRMVLHKTSSIFLRNVAPSIMIQEIEAVCKRFPGFLRIGLAEPLPERKFYRRGWVTFRRDVNIKEICWNLNNIRIRDTDLGAIVNRDLVRRVRCVNGVTNHKQVAQNDLRQAARLTALCDKKAGLFQKEDEEKSVNEFGMDLIVRSLNPLLKNLTDFLIEEASAEEEELLGITSDYSGDSNGDQKVPFHKDIELLEKLDRIIIYLRIVHSIDFYNHGEYPNEDVMPNRCGMMHVRGVSPSGSQFTSDENGNVLLTQKFITDFTVGFNTRLEINLINETVLTEKDLENLGRKDPDKEVEAFIAANSVELAKDKWLCPLSGKKFKGPEFIRKHLTTKHQEKLDEVRQEAEYFNNFLTDPKRPQSPEARMPVPSVSSTQKEERRERDTYENDRYTSRTASGGSYSERSRNYGSSRYDNRRYDRGGPPRYGDSSVGSRRDPREPIIYKDLDAPEDIF
ncbi:unnamed protein product [Dracunculus medinensis]|uniref:Serrate RNA effector molecule homolog n=1 Tax=Dracunculus medinensis TaxID=318479 RepID=A0A0N4ULC8_DRAME|nr:unnamed protein product [Dracunculus medinensis]